MDVTDRGNPRLGWTYVLTIRDLAQILDSPLPQGAESLVTTWGANWEELSEKQENVDTVLASVDSLREQTLGLIKALE